MDYYAQHPAGLYKVEFSVLIFSIWLVLRFFGALDALSSLTLFPFVPCHLSLLSYFWTQLFYPSLCPPSRPSLFLSVSLPTHRFIPSPSLLLFFSLIPTVSPVSCFSVFLFFCFFHTLNHSPFNVNSNCLVREDITVPIMPKALRGT